uniref:Uncharacterized protein n=1 Tax=Candidatus Kentrum sp. LPFa TaxID=2126335 RepID=A0A450WF11_9GAMM|nr:MAG: Uncharacterised protein family (UPF0158) [Candidatus Kentron sp. LPFa]
MKKEDFELEKEFYTATGKWRCTDIGTRVILAIHLNQENPKNYNGPPYSIPEEVFDEYDMEGCSLDPTEFAPMDLEDTKQNIPKSKKFSDIEDAMMFVSFGGYGENIALLDKSTGKIYYRSSDYGDVDEFEEFPEDGYDPDIHIAIPHKNDLDLGRDLVFEFVERFIPDDYGRVDEIFRKQGAYSRYKDLLDSKGILQKWYDFENQREQLALLAWCEENKIDVSD